MDRKQATLRATQHTVFLPGDAVDPDTVSQQLMKSGDIESNPGPGQCEGCMREFSSHYKPVACDECSRKFCRTARDGAKLTCCGLTRWNLKKALENKQLRCYICTGQDQQTPTHNKNNGVEPTECKASKCTNRKIRQRADFFQCQRCSSQFHKKGKCSQMTRAQAGTVNRATWICPNCTDEEHRTSRANNNTEEPPESETKYQKTSSKFTSLKILQFNIDSLLSKVEELKAFIKKHQIDVLAIQETKMIITDRTPCIPGYTIVRRDRSQPKGKEKNRGGGLLIGVRDTIPFKQSRFEIRGKRDKITEWDTIEIPTHNGQKLRITNVYVPPVRKRRGEEEDARSSNPGNLTDEESEIAVGESTATTIPASDSRQEGRRDGNLREEDFDIRRWPSMKYDMVLGDTNAHSPLWDSNTQNGLTDKRGQVFEDWIAGHGMAELNEGTPTHVNRKTGKGSAPDTSFVHSSMLDRCKWKTVNDFGSDHQPIIITYEDRIPTVNNKAKYKWRTREADWSKFSAEIEKNLPSRYQRKNLNKIEKRLRKAILKSANKHVGKKKVAQRNRCEMTEEIKEAIRKRNHLRKSVATNREEWIEACKTTAEMIKNEKQKRWKEYVADIDGKSDAREIWRTVRAIDGRKPPENRNEVLEVKGIAYIKDTDKAKQFAKTYRGFAKIPIRKGDRRIRKKCWKHMERENRELEESEKDINMQEMQRAIEEAANNKAAGEDDIPYEFLKHLGPKAREMLLHIYQRVWRGEEIPRKWLTAIIKPLLKDGKDPKDTTSYRPISLTSCPGKILEKIVANRLIYLLEDRELLTNNQAGFRPNRCTTDQVLKLVQDASDQMQSRTEGNRTVVAFFDYAKAYDKVWRDGLIDKMITQNIPRRYIRYVKTFLSQRKTRVEVNNTMSQQFLLKEGLPQGSSISPILFLIFINDLDVDLDIKTAASLFADDTSAWRKDGRIKGSDRILMQEEIDKIVKWAETWKMKINTSKTKSMVISSAKGDREWDPAFTAEGDKIAAVDEFRFLGVTIANDLRFKTHVDNVVDKSKKRVNIIKCMANKTWGNSLETQKRLYTQYVRSGLEYASPSWSPWISDTEKQRLQRTQNNALRAAAGLSKTCPVDFLHLEVGVEPIVNRMEKNNQLIWERYSRLREDDPRKIMISEKMPPPRLKTRQGFRSKTEPLMQDLQMVREDQAKPVPPWYETGIVFEKVQLEKKKNEYTSEELRARATEKIESLKCEYTVYTDGSTDHNQENGGAGVYIEDNCTGVRHEMMFPAGRLCSSFGAECLAMVEAVRWLTKNPGTAVICTDSLSMHSALMKNDWRNNTNLIVEIRNLMPSTNGKISLLWIPAHCDLPGNEVADDLAKRATVLQQGETPVSYAIAKARIKRRKWSPKHERAIETYGERRQPRIDIESKWPRSVRSQYARLRTGHAKELRHYMYMIEKADDPTCTACGEDEETIKHILCHCPALDWKRIMLFTEPVTPAHMTEQPEKCRQLLEERFPGLKMPEVPMNTVVRKTRSMGRPTNGRQSEPTVAFA